MTALADIIAAHAEKEGPLLPILHGVQAVFDYVSEEAVREVAAALNLTRAEVHGVVSFYHDFRKEPETRRIVKLCRAEACQARGVDALLADIGETPRVKIETVYCLGLCSVGPAAMVGENVHARLDAERLTALMASA